MSLSTLTESQLSNLTGPHSWRNINCGRSSRQHCPFRDSRAIHQNRGHGRTLVAPTHAWHQLILCLRSTRCCYPVGCLWDASLICLLQAVQLRGKFWVSWYTPSEYASISHEFWLALQNTWLHTHKRVLAMKLSQRKRLSPLPGFCSTFNLCDVCLCIYQWLFYLLHGNGAAAP